MLAQTSRRWLIDQRQHFDKHGLLPADVLTLLERGKGTRLTAAEHIETRLLLGSPQGAGHIPSMLENLAQAWACTAATAPVRPLLCREAARQLLHAGHAREALSLLSEAGCDTPAEVALTSKVLAALAKADLGLGAEAAEEAHLQLQAARHLASRLQPRDRAWLAIELLQLLLALFWRASGQTAALGALMSAPELDAAPALGQGLLELLSWPALQDLPASCHEAHALRALAEAAVSPANAELPARLLALAVPAAQAASAQLWTWLGIGNQLAKNKHAAIGCHRHALALAQRSGAHRATLLSSAELATLLAEQGDMQGAYETLCQNRTEQARLQAQTDLPLGSTWRRAAVGPALLPPALAAPGPAAVHVQRARQYIEAHLSRRLTTRELAQACGVSRRTLEQAFRSSLHCSVSDHLRHARLNRVKTRLQLQEASIEAIAADLGYPTVTALSRDFKRHTGQSLQSYRQALARTAPGSTDA